MHIVHESSFVVKWPVRPRVRTLII